MRRSVLQLALSVVLGFSSAAQERLYSVSAKGSLTSSSRLFYNVDATDEFARAQYIEINNVFGYGLEIRRRIENTWFEIGLSIEYLSATEDGALRSGTTQVPVHQGYWTVPVELAGYFTIPFSSDLVKLYIGGGAGVYVGERRYSIGNEEAGIVDGRRGVGIHVLTGLEYSLLPWLALRSEVKFRDLQFESVHAYTKSSTTYNGTTVALNQQPVRSRINVDGMLFDVGVVARF